MSSADVRIVMTDIAELPSSLRSEAGITRGLLRQEGKIFLIRGNRAFSCEDTPEGYALLSALSREEKEPENGEEALRALLSGSRGGVEAVKRFRIPTAGARCLIALACENRRGQNLEEAVRSVAPLEKEDVLAACSPDLTVLIKREEDPEEAAEYALALTDTLEGETGLRLEAGVSDSREGPENWGDAFREATEALKTGRAFRLKGPVYLYRKQILERLLKEIPGEKRREMRRLILGAGETRVLNDEMMETADMFLRSDLNLSDTARQMFIHRNTLTYRLDKIRKETGLDLRRFSDAVIFRVLTALPEEQDL